MVRIAIYLPMQAHKYRTTYSKLQGSLCELYGGFTAYEATGGWKNQDGDTITEPVTVLESYTDKSDSSLRMDLEVVCRWVKDVTNEDSVAYSINHNMYFV